MIVGGSVEGAACEVVTLLPGLTDLRKRSGELDGNLPVRAARYCGPVFEGSAAGVQIVLPQPLTVARDRRGRIACDMTPPTLRLVVEQVDAALERGIKEGLLERNGYWHRLFKGDALPIRGRRLTLWTGHMIRPRPGIWLLVGGAFNRRTRVTVVDHLVTDPDRFVPLVVEIDAGAGGRGPGLERVWMEGELASVMPVSPAVHMRKEKLLGGAAELRQIGDFFSEEYFQTKEQHPTAAYVRRHRDHRVKADEECEARLLYVGPDVHGVGEFDRFIASTGFSRRACSPGGLQFGVVRNIAPTRWVWQGQTHSVFDVAKQRHLPALEGVWRETFGDTRPSALEFFSGYLMGEHWDQPYVQFQPWVLTRTSLGWSSLVDGFHRPPAYDGMRAVIGTDWFFGLAMVYRIFGPSTASIPYRAPMLRTLPVRPSVLELAVADHGTL